MYNQSRAAGVLLHPTSLPGPADHGDLGNHAYYFVKFLSDCGIQVWQTLPLGPTHADLSPYNSISAHAGNPLLISVEMLKDEGWINRHEWVTPSGNAARNTRRGLLNAAGRGFEQHASPAWRAEFAEFVDNHADWLEDYALYYALSEKYAGMPWYDWPSELRNREIIALNQTRRNLAAEIQQARFEQFVFFQQWNNLKKYANDHGISMFGDMAIFIAHDSADVWAHRHCFQLDKNGQPIVVAGVPPDYFSKTGQRWGNPLYDWKKHEDAVITLWVKRARTQMQLFDLIRIDHFRGLEAQWEIPAAESSPQAGKWVKTSGDKLLTILREECANLALIAEDLGFITKEVDQLRQRHNLPGMHVLQFGFDGDPFNHHLPHSHDSHNIIYTGTHDNDTTLGWFNALSAEMKEQVLSYFGYPAESMPWPIIRYAFASNAHLAIIPMQDVIGLGSEHRMNTPGLTSGNWQWRFDWSWVPESVANRLAHFTWRYGRRKK